MTVPWKCLGESIIGTAHVAAGLPCQDAHRLTVVEGVLVAVVADGAGSASRADTGAQTACEFLRDAVCRTLAEGVKPERATVHGWFRGARAELERVAGLHQIDLRELACTALLAVVGREWAIFAQLGDGAIVLPDGDGFIPVFWPEPGEYVNVSDFLTDPGVKEKLLVDVRTGSIEDLALFTDGLQRLALDYGTRRGHPGFFAPLFGPLRSSDDPEKLREPLRNILGSPRVNARTDDDKTLILATRVPARVAAASD
jgi:hypothetical protein